MDDNERNEKYPSNAYRNITPNANKPSTEKNKSVSPVAKGTELKKSFRERLTDSFLVSSGDDIKDRVIFDWIIPGVKNILEDIVHMLLFGDGVARDSGRPRGERRLLRREYNKYYDEDRQKSDSSFEPKSKNPKLTYDSFQGAQDVLRSMEGYLDTYNRVTVKELYEFSGFKNTDYAMNNWGWRDLTGAKVVPYGNKYLLKLPKSEEMRRD